jgi:predicted lysophospholipase L1 biosynthesis ABC-type transport system permease subunit
VTFGSELKVRGPGGDEVDLTVVGRTLVPLEVLGSELSVAEGAVVDLAVVDRLGGAAPSLVVLDLAPGASAEAAHAIFEAHLPVGLGGQRLQGPSHSADLRGYEAVRDTPLLLAGLLATLGVGVLGHTVATSVRRRRRELAMLRVLGFSARQLRSSVRWDVLTVVGTCVLIAVPVGMAGGRLLWTRFARSIGVVDDPQTPVLAVLVVVAVTIAVSLIFALLPGRQATHLRPGPVLRTE